VTAYNEAEEAHRDDPYLEVVPLGSDSRETLEGPHSSYFEVSDKHIGRALAELGLR
jgi:hypothetical protein